MEESYQKLTFPALFGETLRRHGKSNAYAFAGENPITYEEAAVTIRAITAYLEKAGVQKGDRVSILSTNMPNWGMTYFGITFMGAVAVPVLPDFSATEVANILEHSGAKVLFVSASLASRIEEPRPPQLNTIIKLDDFSVIRSETDLPAFDPFAEPSGSYDVDEEDIASIIYTSGTTGRSKGVMLTHKNISFNGLRGKIIQPVGPDDRFLSVLPLSHTYENTLGLILPMLGGSCVYYLRKPPTPPVLLPALEQVRPTVMLTVPLIIEKIFFNKILPAFREKALLKILYTLPPARKLLHAAAGKKLMKTFGGHLKFYGIGGSKLNKTVEKFLREASFPYAIGYGLTETAPLLAGASPSRTVFTSTGPAIKDIELKINDPDKKTGEGEIWARGATIMKGYYKEPELTAEVITPDGWFKTGDLGVLDKNNNLYIRGRIKNMIVGSSGENIYPEEIESVINNFRYVVESLVVEKKGKLVAYVHLNMEELESKYQNLKQEMADKWEEKKQEFLDELKEYVNSKVNKFSRINRVELQPVPFQKTATMKIKRFLYT
ncbi:MAG TPA: AMP-binding protein [Bacteroidales bacterium]|nr:AMP-binding protein [Bacteroidales bacterium]HPF01634.1 AMP-binding protein [Bacteroidales bacterium]HPJ60558.1 AMP-binding protein [Bacteroidales bacterium]HPR13310.1 AMP-binding protein [Bacteroidales bacterium]HRW85621.1 AMP-binding protein [Bacteroidales bacterium]